MSLQWSLGRDVGKGSLWAEPAHRSQVRMLFWVVPPAEPPVALSLSWEERLDALCRVQGSRLTTLGGVRVSPWA